MDARNAGVSRRDVLSGALAMALAVLSRSAAAQSAASSATANSSAMRGKTALVTGSTDGLGREVAMRLGALGARVVVHGRNRERGAEVVRAIQSAGGEAAFHAADFASLDEVRKLSETIRASYDRLDLLINNAGIYVTAGQNARQTSADGHELTFAVNYLAGYLLTYSLLPLITKSAPARIVNVSSLAQQPLDFDDVMLTRGFSPGRAYAQSKLAQILFTMDLAEQLPADRVTATCLHPATYMNTSMVTKAGATPRSTVDEGATAVMNLAVAPALAGRTGLYFNGLQESRANGQAYDQEARARLRKLSRELTGAG